MNKISIDMATFVDTVRYYFAKADIKTIMEIGSLNGVDSLYFKEAFPNSTVYCIEGLPDNYNQYLTHLKGIVPIQMVIADYNGVITFHKKNINGIHGILNRGDEYGTQTLQLECMTAKSLCDKYSITSLDMMKIDVEGATFQILKSMGELLQTVKIMHIETESYPFFKGQVLHDEVEDFLIRNGFTMIDMSSVNIAGGQQHDSIWLNNKYLK